MSTTKVLIGIGILVGILISLGVYFRIIQPEEAGKVFTAVTEETQPEVPVTDIAKYDFIRASLIKALEASMAAVNKRIDDLSKKQTTTTTGVTPLTSLTTETVVASATPAVYTGPKIVYIPIGYGGSTTSTTDFANIAGQEVTINPSDYPGYKQIVFEATFRIYQGNGTAEVRLGNKTDGTSISASNLSTTSQDYVVKSSSSFTLNSGSKTYVVQAKTSTGYAVDLQLTRLRIDF